jgi:hypothetical protein
MRKSVFEMVGEVLQESREKLEKEASVASPAEPNPATFDDDAGSSEKIAGQYTLEDLDKISAACDHLADNLHLVVDDRTPQEKLAEYALIHQALTKKAFEGGDTAHQTQQANPDSVPPVTPPLDSAGVNPGGPSSAMAASETNTPGESLDAGESGQATPGNSPDKVTVPSEKPNPLDAANAMETNKEMMMPEQPEDVLKQAAALRKQQLIDALRKQAGLATLGRMAKSVFTPGVGKGVASTAVQKGTRAVGQGRMASEAALKSMPVGAVRKTSPSAAFESLNFPVQQAGKVRLASVMQQKIAQARAKLAEDAINPASISSGTEPILQSNPGSPSVHSQGSEVGVNTPRQTAPTTGEASGRHHLQSNESAINMTKGPAKKPNVVSAMNELLAEPAFSAAHDKTLQQSLDNTSGAGVKISAARELIERFANQSLEHRHYVDELIKRAQGEEAAVDTGADSEVPPEAAMPPEAEGGELPVSEEALAAAAQGVSPEDLAQAKVLLDAAAEQVAASEAAAPAAEPAPPPAAPVPAAPAAAAPGEEEKTSQGMMGGLSGAGMGSVDAASANAGASTPPPTM